MKNANFAEEENCDATTLTLTDIRTEVHKQTFDTPPGNAPAGRMCEHQCQGSLALSPHACMVPECGTICINESHHAKYGSWISRTVLANHYNA